MSVPCQRFIENIRTSVYRGVGNGLNGTPFARISGLIVVPINALLYIPKVIAVILDSIVDLAKNIFVCQEAYCLHLVGPFFALCYLVTWLPLTTLTGMIYDIFSAAIDPIEWSRKRIQHHTNTVLPNYGGNQAVYICWVQEHMHFTDLC